MKKQTKMQKKIGTVMGEFKSGTLHSGKGGRPITKPMTDRQKATLSMAKLEYGRDDEESDME